MRKEEKALFSLNGYNGQLYVYSDKIVIKRKNFMGLVHHGLVGDKIIPFSSITSIQLKKAGLSQGFIQFGVMGGIERQRGKRNAKFDENSIIINILNNKEAEKIVSYMNNKIANGRTQNVNSTRETLSTADELMKLKLLLDSGALTNQEFEIEKKKLLNSK